MATTLTAGLDALEPYLTRYIPALILVALVTPAALFVVLGFDWIAFLICLITLPLVPVFMRLTGQLTATTSKRRLATAANLGGQVLDLLAGLPTLRAYGRALDPIGWVRELGERVRVATMQTMQIAFLSSMVLELLTTISVAMVAVSVGLRLVEGELSLRAGLAVIMLAPEVFWPLRQVGAQFHASADGLAATDAVFEILAAPESAAFPLLETNEQTAVWGADISAIALENVSVRARGENVLAPASLSTRIDLNCQQSGPGQIVAIAGPSGSGKSTTALLILGLLSPDEGRVWLETDQGQSDQPLSISEYGFSNWWRQFAWVPQRPALAPGTIRTAAAGDKESQVELDRAAELTGLTNVIQELPQGWDTPIGAGGVGLSVGQRQRVALTAALVAGSEKQILLLDEPTAHLDPIGEEVLLNTLRAWRESGRTAIVVAHRPSLIALADQQIRVQSRAEQPAQLAPESFINARSQPVAG